MGTDEGKYFVPNGRLDGWILECGEFGTHDDGDGDGDTNKRYGSPSGHPTAPRQEQSLVGLRKTAP